MNRPINAALAVVALCLAVGGCASPARHDKMMAAEIVTDQRVDASLAATVYGEAGGFVAHYYELPREDVEQALLLTLQNSSIFRSVTLGGEADYKLAVGLMHLVQPQWSGTVTLETTWSLASSAAGGEPARMTIKTTSPASFTEKREATEAATIRNFEEGIAWMLSVIDQESVAE